MKGNLIMKNILIFLGVVVILAVGGFFYYVSVYNQAVRLEESVKATWSQVLNQYERRSDLIPNLVATVKGYATHEKNLLEEVTAKRAAIGQVRISVDDLNDAAKVQAFQQAQNALSGALSRLIALSENYPDLKANQNFLSLQSQLEGTENRIAVARRDYIELIRHYNSLLKSIPAKWVLNGQFKPYAEYTIEEQKKAVPVVQFE